MRLRLYENHRLVLYAPFYAAHVIGDSCRHQVSGLAERTLLDGAVEVLCAGPMRAMKHHDENPNTALVCFAEFVCRDPFSIVGQYPIRISGSPTLPKCALPRSAEVPTPWLCLREDLRQAGIDPARLDGVAGCGMAENLNALARAESRQRSFSSSSSKNHRPREGSPVVRRQQAWSYHLIRLS